MVVFHSSYLDFIVVVLIVHNINRLLNIAKYEVAMTIVSLKVLSRDSRGLEAERRPEELT